MTADAPRFDQIEYVGGPLDATTEARAGLPPELAAPGGRYVRSVRCAEDGAMRYVWAAARGPETTRPVSEGRTTIADWKLSPGDWCHVDVVAGDRARAQKFYGEVFGWTFEDYGEDIGYIGVKTSENGIESGIGGLAQSVGARSPAPNGVVPYILAPDIDATLEAIRRAGGTIEIPRTDAFGYGEFAHFRDPDGNLIGLWRDAPGEP